MRKSAKISPPKAPVEAPVPVFSHRPNNQCVYWLLDCCILCAVSNGDENLTLFRDGQGGGESADGEQTAPSDQVRDDAERVCVCVRACV